MTETPEDRIAPELTPAEVRLLAGIRDGVDHVVGELDRVGGPTS